MALSFLGVGPIGSPGVSITLDKLIQAPALTDPGDPAKGYVAVTPATEAQGKILAAELGLTFQDTIAKNTLDAFTDPGTAWGNYQTARAALDKNAVDVFKKAAHEAMKYGASQSIAAEYARTRALENHAAEMQLLKIAYPFAGDGSKLIEIASGARKTGHGKGGKFTPA